MMVWLSNKNISSFFKRYLLYILQNVLFLIDELNFINHICRYLVSDLYSKICVVYIWYYLIFYCYSVTVKYKYVVINFGIWWDLIKLCTYSHRLKICFLTVWIRDFRKKINGCFMCFVFFIKCLDLLWFAFYAVPIESWCL